MKKIILIAAIIAAQFSFAQVKKEVGDFTKVRVFDRINVTLIPSDVNRIEITGSRSEEVEVLNKNGELKVRMPLKKLLNGEEISANLYFKRLEVIDATEGSFIGCGETFKQSSLEVSAKEGAEVKIHLDVQKIQEKAHTGGTLTLSGIAVNQDITIRAGGIVNARDLKTSQTTVTISAGGDAEISATELVDATVKAGGKVKVYGKPIQLKQKTTLGGTIEQMP